MTTTPRSRRFTMAEWEEHVAPFLVADEATGCLLWSRGRTGDGYGLVTIDGSRWYVHRVAHEVFVGPIPDRYVVDHVAERGCVHRHCANHGHLEAVTITENASVRSGWTSAKAECRKGHPLDGDNLVMQGGRRRCRTCVTASARAGYLRRRAA